MYIMSIVIIISKVWKIQMHIVSLLLARCSMVYAVQMLHL